MTIKEIIPFLERTSSFYGYYVYQVFNDYIDLLFAVLLDQKEAFDKILEKYPEDSREKVGKDFVSSFKVLKELTTERKQDILGEVYETLSLNHKKGFGQFFTPFGVAELMAKSLLDDKDNPSVLDPTVGSGRLLIAVYNLKPNGTFVGQDIDYTCVKMCAINFYFLQVSGYIIWGDSLKLEVKAVFKSFPGKLEKLEDTTSFAQEYHQAIHKSAEVQS